MSFIGWKFVTKNNSTIEKLSMKWGNNLNDKILSLVTKNLDKLKHLRIGTGFKGTRKTFLNINKNCKNLKVLEILKDNLNSQKIKEDDLKKLKIPGLLFYPYENLLEAFKEEAHEWHDEVQMFEAFDSSDDFFDFDTSEEMDSSDDFFGVDMGFLNLMQLINGVGNSGSDEDDRYGYYFGGYQDSDFDDYDGFEFGF
jgi:hypothetical protein